MKKQIYLLFALVASPLFAATEITPIGAFAETSFSNDAGTRGPSRAIDGSGLQTDGSHGTDASTSMWMGGNSGNAGGAKFATWFVVDLGDVHSLGAMHIWNFNMAGYVNRGLKQIDVFVSTENSGFSGTPDFSDGSTWSLVAEDLLLSKASGTADYTGETPLDFTGVEARWVGFRIDSLFVDDDALSAGGGYGGLSEVKFYEYEAPPAAELVNLDEFEYRAEVTFPGYTGERALAEFPVLVRLAETEGGFSYSQAAPGGADLRFALADGSVLASEIDVWNEEGESLVWVRIPQLVSGASIYLYWGGVKSEYPASQSDGSVWTGASYAGVWHLEESGDSFSDSAGNGLDGTRKGTVGRVSDGKIGGAHRISSGSQQGKDGAGITVPNYNALGIGGSFTISGWLRYPQGQTPGYDRIFSRKNAYNDSNGWEVTLRSGSKQNLDHRGANSDAQQTPVFADISDGAWHHLAITYNGTSSSVFVDGVCKAADKNIGAAATDNGKILVFGNNASYGETTFKGILDEIRLRDAVADETWVAAEYASMEPGFAVVGAPEAIDHDLPVLVPPSGFVPDYHSVDFSWTLRNAGSSATHVVAEIGTESGVYPRTETLASDVTEGISGVAALDGLLCNTTYYVRLSAINGSGTSSSAEVSFKTLGALSFAGETLTVSREDALTASAMLASPNPNAIPTVSLFFRRAGTEPALQREWTATTNPETFVQEISGLLLGDYEAYFEAEAACSVCEGLSVAVSSTVSATLSGECRWTGSVGDLSWNTPGNWSSGTVPGPLDTVVFPAGSVASGVTISLDTVQTVTEIVDESAVSFRIGSDDDAAEARQLVLQHYIREGESDATLTIYVPVRFALAETGTNLLFVSGGVVRFSGAFTVEEALQPIAMGGAGTVALAAAGGTPRPHFLVEAGVLQPEVSGALRGDATIGGGDASARLNCTVNQALGSVGTITALTNGYALLRQTGWGHMPDTIVARDGGTVQVYDWSYGRAVRLTGGTLKGGFMNCGSYSGQGIFSYASAQPSFFQAGFTFNQYGSAVISVEDGDAIVDLTITGKISWASDSWNSLNKNGAGTLRMTGSTNTKSSQPFQLNGGTLLCDNVSGTPFGNTTLNVNAGTVLGGCGFIGGYTNGNVVVSATESKPSTIAPGTVDENTGEHIFGTLTIGTEGLTNSVALGSWSRLSIGVSARDAEIKASMADKLKVFGEVSIGENCTLDLVANSAVPEEIEGGRFTIVEADRISGSFAMVEKPEISWKIEYVSEEADGEMVVKRIDLTVPMRGSLIFLR